MPLHSGQRETTREIELPFPVLVVRVAIAHLERRHRTPRRRPVLEQGIADVGGEPYELLAPCDAVGQPFRHPRREDRGVESPGQSDGVTCGPPRLDGFVGERKSSFGDVVACGGEFDGE